MSSLNQVVCIKKDSWRYASGPFKGLPSIGPAYNQIVTIHRVTKQSGKIFFEFHEFLDHLYDVQWFEPIVDDLTLSEELATIFAPAFS
jgi:hypothetical protein